MRPTIQQFFKEEVNNHLDLLPSDVVDTDV
jgi:hypothetical protein